MVVPCHDEGEQVERAYEAITRALGTVVPLEVIFVDDGSTDDTLERLRRLASADARVRYLSLTRNFGQHAAVIAAFRYATQPWTVQLDADLQFPPAETGALLAKAAEGYDVVFGARRVNRDGPVRRLGSAGHRWAARRLLGIEVPEGASSFRAVRTGLARVIADLPTANSHLPALVAMVGGRYASVPVDHRPRTAGRSRFRLPGLVGFAFELFFGFSWRPLVAVYLFAVAAVLASLVVVALAAAGAASPLAVAVAALLVAAGGVACVAIVGRYLHARLLDARPRRRYYVREANVPLRPEDTFEAGVPPVPPPAVP